MQKTEAGQRKLEVGDVATERHAAFPQHSAALPIVLPSTHLTAGGGREQRPL